MTKDVCPYPCASVPLGVRVHECVSETEAIWQWPTCSGRCLTNSPKQTIVKQAERQRQQQQLQQQQQQHRKVWAWLAMYALLEGSHFISDKRSAQLAARQGTNNPLK